MRYSQCQKEAVIKEYTVSGVQYALMNTLNEHEFNKPIEMIKVLQEVIVILLEAEEEYRRRGISQ